MNRLHVTLILVMSLLLSSCAGQKGYKEGPFAAYTHEVFHKEGTQETGLYLSGENFFCTVNIPEFKTFGNKLESENQFLSRINPQGIVLNIFAEKIDKVTEETSCRVKIFSRVEKRITRQVEIKTLGEHRVVTYVSNKKRYIDYCPFYEGYCFDFQFCMDERMSEKAILGIIDSIHFINDPTMKDRMSKIFYIYDKKLMIKTPSSWLHRFRTSARYEPSIVFTPAEGDSFAMYLSPYKGFENTSVYLEEIQKLITKRMKAWEERAVILPSLQELNDGSASLYYFDVTDRYYHPEDKGDYPYQRQGYAIINKVAFSFTILYRESGKEEADKAIQALSKAEIFDLESETSFIFLK